MPVPGDATRDALPRVQPAAVAAALAVRAAVALQTLPSRLHPEWIASLGPAIASLAGAGGALLNELLLLRFDLRWPDLSAAGQPLGALWLLPRDEVVRVCAARGLFACRCALARSVDAGVRRRARLQLGEATFEALVALGQDRWSTSPLARLPSPDEALDLGWALLQDAIAWRDTRSHRLVRLMLPPRIGSPPEPALAPCAAPDEHARFAGALPQLFPEHSWLFGSGPVTSMLA